MTTEAQNVKFRRQMAKLQASKRTPDKVKMPYRVSVAGLEVPFAVGGPLLLAAAMQVTPRQALVRSARPFAEAIAIRFSASTT
jgi:hypothetical protein